MDYLVDDWNYNTTGVEFAFVPLFLADERHWILEVINFGKYIIVCDWKRPDSYDIYDAAIEKIRDRINECDVMFDKDNDDDFEIDYHSPMKQQNNDRGILVIEL